MTPAYAAPRPSVIGPTVLVALAALLVRLVVTGEYANFVKPGDGAVPGRGGGVPRRPGGGRAAAAGTGDGVRGR